MFRKNRQGDYIGLDLTGVRHNKLVILGFSEYRGYSRLWDVRCDCGKEFKIITYNFIKGKGNCRQCGRKEGGLKHRKDAVTTLIKALTQKYRYAAEIRDIDFNLELKDVEALIFEKCYYCGTPPAQTTKSLSVSEIIKYNGIDRLNSNVIYTPSNCVTCCKLCNWIKRDLSITDFYAHLDKIFLNRLNK